MGKLASLLCAIMICWCFYMKQTSDVFQQQSLHYQCQYLNRCWIIIKLILRNKFHWYLNQSIAISIQEISFENAVCKIATIVLYNVKPYLMPGMQAQWCLLVKFRLHVCIDPALGLSFLVPGPEYSRRTRPVPWLLIPWFIESPGYQQQCSVNKSLSLMGKDFNCPFQNGGMILNASTL